MKKPSLVQRLIWAGVPALAMAAFLAGVAIFHWYVDSAPVFPHAEIVIQHARGRGSVPYDVELATTAAQQTQGLMFRRSLPANGGMLFLFDTDMTVTFWMKNTYIPLDMLFVRHDGVIAKIVAHTKPFDLSHIPSDEPVRGVIEIGGGEAQRLGIKTGDKVLYSAFSDSH
jgi:uncharacterized membrane protein (UPF0127 family)